MTLENWMGEILLIILLIFLICPRDIPKIMHFIGKSIGSLKKYREKARISKGAHRKSRCGRPEGGCVQAQAGHE